MAWVLMSNTPSQDGQRLKTSHFIRKSGWRRPRSLLRVNFVAVRRVEEVEKRWVAGRKSLADKKARQGPEWGGAAYQLQPRGVIGGQPKRCRCCLSTERDENVDLKQTG